MKYIVLIFAILMLALVSCDKIQLAMERNRELDDILDKLDSLTVEFDKTEKLKLLERFNKQGDIIIMKMKLMNKADSIQALRP